MKKLYSLLFSTVISLSAMAAQPILGIRPQAADSLQLKHHPHPPVHKTATPLRAKQAPSASMQQMDSLIKQEIYPTMGVFTKSLKVIYSYDANGNNISEIDQGWQFGLSGPNNGTWGNFAKETYMYDANGNLTASYQSSWINNAWVDYQQENWTYDANNNRLVYTSSMYDNTSQRWWTSAKNVYNYDANGNELSYIPYYCSGSQLLKQTRDTCIYDVNNNMVLKINSNWINNSWNDSYKYTYTYDANGNELSEIDSDIFLQEWMPLDEYLYTYDANGKKTTYTYSSFNDGDWQIINGDDYAYFYASGKIASDIQKQWGGTDGWINQKKTAYNYDADGNQTSESFFSWDYSNNLWINNENKISTYNNDYAEGEFYRPTFTYFPSQVSAGLASDFPAVFNSEINSQTISELVSVLGSAWMTESIYTFYYSPFSPITGINAVSSTNTSVSLSPNPARDVLNIHWTNNNTETLTLSLYNIGGQLVLQQTIGNNASVSVSNLPAGVYIYNLSNGAKGKIIKNE
jgi:hypothetical protein